MIVSNLNDSGAGSLRAAIEAVNAGTGACTIQFTVNGTVTLTSRLPVITRSATIDATTAPTHVAGGPPVVEIDCNGHAGLEFGAGSDGSQLLGMSVASDRGPGQIPVIVAHGGEVEFPAIKLGNAAIPISGGFQAPSFVPNLSCGESGEREEGLTSP